MRKPKTLLSLLLLKLQADPPRSPIKRVFVDAHPAPHQVLQPSLLEPAGPKAEDLSRTLARLTALVGEENLGSPRVEDSHCPDTASLKDYSLGKPLRRRRSDPEASPQRSGGRRIHLILRRIRPPRPIRLRTDRILACTGPWKTSGQWWERSGKSPSSSQSWWRDEWDVQLSGGGVYRVFWDHRCKEWFMDGTYD